MTSTTYSFFNNFIFRTPLFPFEINEYPEEYITIFNEALYIASPEFFNQKIVIEQDKTKAKNKLNTTLNKYITRASFRCTPFGLFAGCSIGEFSNSTHIELVNLNQYCRNTRLDMEYLYSLIDYLGKQKNIQNNLHYFPNDSIYEAGGEIRYVEYYYEGIKKLYQLTSIDKNSHIIKILKKAKNGATIKDLAKSIIDNDIDEENATQFVEQLINAQLIKNRLEVSLTKGEPLDQLIQNLEKYEDYKHVTLSLREIKTILKKIDKKKLGNDLFYYRQAETIIKKLGVPYNFKHLFQVDLYKPVKIATLSHKIIDEIYQIISLENALVQNFVKPSLAAFKKAFAERYEEQEIPLVIALDKDLGIGYPIDRNTEDSNPLIDDLVLPKPSAGDFINSDYIQTILLEKYTKALQNKENIIHITKEDFPQKLQNYENLPDTLTIFCSLIKENKETEEQIDMKFIGGGASGARLFSRFCHSSPDLFNFSQEITKKEQEINSNAILCEIIHSPQPRSCNIMIHPPLREYEIHYIAESGVEPHKRIPVSDLLISLKKDRIYLKSKKLDQEIIPRLTNAQNYDYDSLPIYQFLCDIQSQNTKPSIMFQWGSLFQQFNYFPRVMFKNHILSHEKWRIEKHEIQHLYKLNGSNLIKATKEFRKSRKIPSHVILNENGTELFINLTNNKSIQMMLDIEKYTPYFYLEECLFKKESTIVKNDEGYFTNEFIFTLYRNQNKM